MRAETAWVLNWLRSLDMVDRRVIGKDIKDIEFSWPIGMPLVRSTPKQDMDLALKPMKGESQ